MKRTPGLWTAEVKSRHYGDHFSEPGWVVTSPERFDVICDTGAVRDTHAEGNAKLIASAPVLLDGIDLAIEFLKSGTIKGRIINADELRSALITVAKQARGES